MRSCLHRRLFLKYSIIFSFAILGVFYSGARQASASSWDTCNGDKIRWSSGWTNMYLSTTSFPIGSVWDSHLQYPMWRWNNVKGSGFNFYVGRDTDGSHSSSNGVNEIYFETNSSGALATTYSRQHCYWLFGWRMGMDEADIGFNLNYTWYPGGYSTTGGYSFEGVALHELGHALGLNHEDRWMATLNSYYPNSGPFGYYNEWDPLADDRGGERYLYPDSTVETDIAASIFKQTGTGTSGWVSSPYSATRGSSITTDFTFSNLGTATQSFNIGFYLSSDEYINTYDTFLGGNYGAWGGPGFTGTFSRTLIIPTWIAPGTYYLGYIMDYDGMVPEANESNGFRQMPHTIIIY